MPAIIAKPKFENPIQFFFYLLANSGSNLITIKCMVCGSRQPQRKVILKIAKINNNRIANGILAK